MTYIYYIAYVFDNGHGDIPELPWTAPIQTAQDIAGVIRWLCEVNAKVGTHIQNVRITTCHFLRSETAC